MDISEWSGYLVLVEPQVPGSQRFSNVELSRRPFFVARIRVWRAFLSGFIPALHLYYDLRKIYLYDYSGQAIFMNTSYIMGYTFSTLANSDRT